MATKAKFISSGVTGTTSTVGDIRFNVVGADYSGFYRMDGRASGVLPANAQAGLVNLGLAAIPNAQNRKIRMGGALGTTGGTLARTLTQANMPSGNIVGTTNTDGDHDHGISGNNGVRNAANLAPRANNGTQATSAGAITANANTNPHGHTFTVPTGGTATPFNLSFATVSVGYYICLDNTQINTWIPINGDVKHAFNTVDHNGWILLDGRLKTALTATQQAVATALGIGVNLPNGANRTIKMKGAVYTLAGNDSLILALANLPNVNVNVTSTTSGNTHDHILNNGTVRSANNNAVNWASVQNGQRDMPAETIGIDPAGAHPHNYSLAVGGNDTPISLLTPYLTANAFIYLGL